jgi:alpha-glucosidase
MRLICLLLVTFAFVSQGFSEVRVESPGGNLAIVFRIDDHGMPEWQVLRKGGVLLAWSPLGLTFREGSALRFRMLGSEARKHDETYELVVGKTKRARDHYRELEVNLEEPSAPRRRLNLLFRAYDDGAAFRYVLPEQDALGAFEIVKENTEFHFPVEMTAWAFHTDTFRSSFEGRYLPTTLGAIPETGMVNLPLTMQREDGVALAIAEADLTDYAGMYLRSLGRGVASGGAATSETGRGAKAPVAIRSAATASGGPALGVVLAPLPEEGGGEEGKRAGSGGSRVAVRGRTPFASPWRVLMVGDAPGRLIESTIILNLNPPCALDDVSWIKPGKAMFPWWPDFYCDRPGVPSALGFENQKCYIDFAAANRIPYLELEPPWYGPETDCIEHPEKYDITKPVPELRLPELLEYAKRAGEQGVSFFIWAHWRNVDRQADVAFPLYKSWGAAGVKIDFMNRDDQEMIRWYPMILKKAAANRLMVYFHGTSKPTGTQRTYPNLVTVEGVLGNEQNKVIDAITPEHTVTLPFTRMLVGPMDFTPGGFRNVTAAEFKPDYKRPRVMGTRCHQLAMYVVYESPLAMVSDDPAAYRGQPAFAFVGKVPTSWDETRAIDGEIGRYVTIARRCGADWYLGAMTDWTAREIRVPLEFLGAGRFEAEIYEDGPDADTRPVEVTILHKEVTSATTLTARLAKGGGLAVRFRKLES